jgi:RND family efflux transporter MFP subunit
MQRRTLIVGGLGAVAVTGLAVAGALLAKDRGGGVAVAAVAVNAPLDDSAGIATVALREVDDFYAADAVIEAVRQATVSAQIPGTVTQFYVDAGDRVKRGQLLARIDTRATDAQVAAGSASVAQAEAALAQAKVNYERTQALIEQSFVSRAALDKAEADYKAALAGVEAARANRTQATTARSFAEVRSPIDGVVTRRLMELGELAAPGKPVVAVYDPSALRAVGSIPQFVLPRTAKVTKVTKAAIELPTLGELIAATKVAVLPAADARMLSTEVRAELPAQVPPGVVPGTAAKIRVPTGAARKLVMPDGAIVRRGELIAAYVVDAQGQTSLRQIRVGSSLEGGQIEVLAGLADGERVRLNPLAQR